MGGVRQLEGLGSWSGGDAKNWERKIGAGIRVIQRISERSCVFDRGFVGQSRWIILQMRCRAK